MIRSLTRLKAPNPLRMLLAVLAVAAATALLAACSSSGSSSAGGSGSTSTSSPVATTAGSSLKTATIGGVTVLTNAQGFAVYSFAPDTMTKSDCNGACAAAWPPVKGPPPGRVSPASSARLSAPTARPRPSTTGTLCTPSSRTPARARTRATASTRSAGCGTRSPRRVQQRRRPPRPAVRPSTTVPRRATPRPPRQPAPPATPPGPDRQSDPAGQRRRP